MNPTDVAQKIPDLFQKTISEQGMPASSMSASEMLAQDLFDLLKMDKRALYGESTLTNVSETAAKATKAMKSGISNLAKKGKRFLNNRKSYRSSSSFESASSDLGEEDEGDAGDDPEIDQSSMTPDVVYIQGSRNEIAEEEARIAFSSFFLSMFGNMRWYLSATPGQLPHLDRNRFLQQKRAMGEGESSPIWPLLQNFCQSQMLEQFAKARVDEVRMRLPVTSDSALFTQCANYHRLNNIDFSVMNVRRVVRQVAQSNPSRLIMQTSARRTAMLLTSNKTYEGEYNKTVARLVEECRECTSALFDVMSVIWVRLGDSKGVHWKHGLQALQVLRNLLYHGPMAAIAEATDGLIKIRAMKFYNENMRAQICTQIRQAAHQVYNLLVDRTKLFHIRRICANKRRLLVQPQESRYVKNSRIAITHRFGAMHQHFNPASRGRVAPAPHAAASPNEDIFGLTTSSPANASAARSSTSDAAQDLVGLFGNVDISDQASIASSLPPNNPFAQAPVTNGSAPQAPSNPFAQAPVTNGSAPPHPSQPLPPKTAYSNHSSVVPTPAPTARPHDPFAQAPVANAQVKNIAPNHPHAPKQPTAALQGNGAQMPYTQQARAPQSHPYQQQHAMGAPTPGAPAGYASALAQKPTAAAPPQQSRPTPPQQNYYQPTHMGPPQGRYPPHQQQTGPPPQATYPPQQQHQLVPQQQIHHHQQQSYPPMQQQQQYFAQQAPPQPQKPNLSQFDPFK